MSGRAEGLTGLIKDSFTNCPSTINAGFGGRLRYDVDQMAQRGLGGFETVVTKPSLLCAKDGKVYVSHDWSAGFVRTV